MNPASRCWRVKVCVFIFKLKLSLFKVHSAVFSYTQETDPYNQANSTRVLHPLGMACRLVIRPQSSGACSPAVGSCLHRAAFSAPGFVLLSHGFNTCAPGLCPRPLVFRLGPGLNSLLPACPKISPESESVCSQTVKAV